MHRLWKAWKNRKLFEDILNGEKMSSTDFKLFVFDMDGVLTGDSSSWNYVHKRFQVDNRELRQKFEMGKISYEEFLRGDVKLWIDKRGKVSRSEIISILNEIPLRMGLADTINLLRSRGKKVAIVSGGISWLADRIESSARFDCVQSNHLLTDSSGYLIPDGKVEVDFQHKDTNVRDIQEKFAVDKENTVCIGDSFDDRSMFQEAGYSIAFSPRHPDLTKFSDAEILTGDLMDIVRLVDKL